MDNNFGADSLYSSAVQKATVLCIRIKYFCLRYKLHFDLVNYLFLTQMGVSNLLYKNRFILLIVARLDPASVRGYFFLFSIKRLVFVLKVGTILFFNSCV